jgi:hypothetical protein
MKRRFDFVYFHYSKNLFIKHVLLHTQKTINQMHLKEKIKDCDVHPRCVQSREGEKGELTFRNL